MLPKACAHGFYDVNCQLSDILFGLMYFMPTKSALPPSKSNAGLKGSGSKPVPPPDPDGQFYNFGLRVLNEVIDAGKNGDLYFQNNSFDAMSLSASVEKKRLKSQNKLNDFAYSESAWQKAFGTLCKGRCNLLSFRMLETSATPVLNDYFYRRNSSIAFKDSLYNKAIHSNARSLIPANIQVIAKCFVYQLYLKFTCTVLS